MDGTTPLAQRMAPAVGIALIVLVTALLTTVIASSQPNDTQLGRQQVYYHLADEFYERWKDCEDVADYERLDPALVTEDCEVEYGALELVLQQSKRSRLIGDPMYRYIYDPAEPVPDTGRTYEVEGE